MLKVQEILSQQLDPSAYGEKQLKVKSYMSDLQNTAVNIVKAFMDVMYNNKLLGVECLFRFPSREVKNEILSNYKSDYLG